MQRSSLPVFGAVLALSLVFGLAPAKAQTLAAQFATDYSLAELGTPAGVPSSFGGLTVNSGNSNSLLLGGAANSIGAAIYDVSLVRAEVNGVQRITGFTGTATQFATAPQIDGGLAYGPGGVLFATTFSNNNLLQYKPGSTSPDRVINLSDFGIAGTTGTIQFAPNGTAIIGSYSAGTYYAVSLTADGNGTYDVSTPLADSGFVGGGPEGIVFVPMGSAVFANLDANAQWMLVSEYSVGTIAAYKADANYLPILSTRLDFITGITGAEGAAIDPVSSDFLFSTFGGGDRVVAVRGFALIPEPATLPLGLIALAATALTTRLRRRRK